MYFRSFRLLASTLLAPALFAVAFCGGGQSRGVATAAGAARLPEEFREIDPPQRRQIAGRAPVRFYLQPFSNVTLELEGEAVNPRLIRRDKTLALMQVEAPYFRDGQGARLTATAAGFRPGYRLLKAQEDPRDPPLLMLDADGSPHRFVARWMSGEQPKSVTFLDERRVILPLMKAPGIDVIHIETGKTLRVAPPQNWARHHGFVETAVLPERGEFWVSQMYTHAVHVFDSATLAYKRTIKLKGRWVKVLRHDPRRGRVYASNWNSGDLSIIDTKTYEVVGNIRVGGVPRGMQLSEEGDHLWIAQFGGENDTDGSGRIVEYDLENDRVLRRFGVPGSKRHIVRAPEIFFVSDMSAARVEAYDATTGQFLKNIDVYYKPNTIVLTPDRKRLYVSCRGPNNPHRGYLHKGLEMGRVYVIDTKTLEVTEYWEGGNQPTGLAVSPDGRYVVSSDFLDHAIRVYRRLDG